MSTHCLIGVRTGPERIVYAYVHYDGYPSNIGKTLLDHYSTGSSQEIEAKILKAIEQGDMCSFSADSHSNHDPLRSGESDLPRICRDALALAQKGYKRGAIWVYLLESTGWLIAYVRGREWTKFTRLTRQFVEAEHYDEVYDLIGPLNPLTIE